MSEATGSGIVVDARAADRLKAERLVRLHTVEIPVLRVIGMALVSTGPPVYDLLIRGTTAWRWWLTYAVAVNAYALGSWIVLFFLWGASLYIATFALATERRRATTAAAIRMARESITTLRDRSEQLEEAKRRAETASRAKTQFLASVSHELRTPLNAIIGFSQILKGKASQVLTSKETGYAETILNSARHLLHVVTDILDLSRIDMGRET